MKKNNGFVLLIFISLTLISVSVQAAEPLMSEASVLSILKLSMAPAANKLLSQGMIWLAAFASIQLVITNFGLLKSGADVEAIFGKLMGSLLWLGFCIYILQNGPEFIGDVGEQFFKLFGITLPSPGVIIASTISVVTALAVAAAGVGAISNTSGMLIVYILLLIFAVGTFFAIKIFMVELELGLIIMLSPLSFAFLGLNALKDQGIAPFKALISLGYRILLMTIILSAYTEVGNAVAKTLENITGAQIIAGLGQFFLTIGSGLGAYMVLAYLLYKSDAIANSLASGGTNMGTGDVASAAAAGAAAGAAIGAGGAVAATKVGQPMSDVIKNMMGAGGGSIANASPSGVGGTSNPPPPPPKQPEMSLKQMQEHPSNIANQGESAGGGSSAPSPAQGRGEGPTKPAGSGAEPAGSGAEPVAPSGSGANAGIGGAGGKTDEKLDKLIDSLSQTKKPSFGERVGSVNDQIAREQAATHVSINTNAGD